MNGPWQAGLTNADNTPATTRDEADAIATSIGWVIESEEDAEMGVWLVMIPEADAQRAITEGHIGLTSKAGWGEIEMVTEAEPQ